MSFIISNMSIAYKITLDRRVPLTAKIVMVTCLSYIAWPFDLIPDNIPFWGYADDWWVVILGCLTLKSCIPKNVIEEHFKSNGATIPRGFLHLEQSIYGADTPISTYFQIMLSWLSFFFFSMIVIYKSCLIHCPAAAKDLWAIGYAMTNN